MLIILAGYAGYPAWVANALGGLAPCIHKNRARRLKTSATTLLELLTRPELLKAARADLEEHTGGMRRVVPLPPKDFAAPIGYRWPEYPTKPRGDDGWIPPAADLAS
jgi:aminobenzoyl-glutamate utilization protein B